RRWRPRRRAPASSPTGWVNCGSRAGSRGGRWRRCAGLAVRPRPRGRRRPPRRWGGGRRAGHHPVSPALSGLSCLGCRRPRGGAGRIDELSTVGARALDDLAHDLDLTAAVHLLLARAAVGAGVPADAGRHLDAVSALGALSPRRTAQVRIVRAAAVIAGGSPERLALSARLAEQAVTAAGGAAAPDASWEGAATPAR